MAYQRIKLSTGENIGPPVDLPADLRGLADGSLADLSWVRDGKLGYVDTGFIPVADPEPDTPPAPRVLSVFEFMYERFTLAERLAIHASADPVVQDFVRALDVIPRVELDGPLTVQGVGYMAQQGLIKAGRVAEVLA